MTFGQIFFLVRLNNGNAHTSVANIRKGGQDVTIYKWVSELAVFYIFFIISTR